MVDFRRQFDLPSFDLEFLERRSLPWEAVREGGIRWVILHEYEILPGYNHGVVSAALQLSASYPDTQIDMVYFVPHLLRSTGTVIRAISDHIFDGKAWQRWSRHRTEAHPWRRGFDCIETHILLVNEWLERELRQVA